MKQKKKNKINKEKITEQTKKKMASTVINSFSRQACLAGKAIHK